MMMQTNLYLYKLLLIGNAKDDFTKACVTPSCDKSEVQVDRRRVICTSNGQDSCGHEEK